MPVIARIDWIRHQLEMGRRGHICIGEALDASKIKVTITLEPASAGQPSTFARAGLLASLTVVQQLAIKSVAVDRGHKHSMDGQSLAYGFRRLLGLQ